MFTFTPSEAPATRSSMEFVASLLAVLADPKTAQEHLAQMHAAMDEIVAGHADLNAKIHEHESDKAASAVALDARAADLTKREGAISDIAAASADADRRTAAASDAEAKLAVAQQAHIEREAGVQQLEKAAAARHRELDTRSAALDARERILAEQESDHRARVERIKAAAV